MGDGIIFNTDTSLTGASAVSGIVEPHETPALPTHPPRNVSLAVLCILAVIFALSWAKEVLIPLMLGILASYALSPIIDYLQKRHIPRALGSAGLLLGIISSVVVMGYSLSDEAASFIETLPEAAENFRIAMSNNQTDSTSALDNLQQAAEQIQQVALDDSADLPQPPDGVARVQIEDPGLNIRDYVRLGTLGALALVGQIAVVLFLVFFLLAAGDTFRRKIVKITGPTFSNKKITLQVLHEITDQIQRYLLVQVVISILVGIGTWLVFLLIGVQNAAIWGIAAAVLNPIPYLGPVVITGVTAVVAFLQFNSVGMAVLVGGASLMITSLEGLLLTPWLIGRASRLNVVTVFLGVLFWGWLWGVWGLLVGLPIIMVIKCVCDRVEDLKPIGELLGE